jgi:hypothetical protein
VRIVLGSSALYLLSLDTLQAELNQSDALFHALHPPNSMMEPSAILLASPPRDSAFQVLSDILGSSESVCPAGPLDSREAMEATRDTGLMSTRILEDGLDPDSGWVIEGKEGVRASTNHHLIYWM